MLLDIQEATPLHDIDRLDNFRTTADDEWKPLFHIPLDTTATVVLDGRFDTPALRYERDMIPRLHSDQVVIVLASNGRLGLLESLAAEQRAFYDDKAVKMDAANLLPYVQEIMHRWHS